MGWALTTLKGRVCWSGCATVTNCNCLGKGHETILLPDCLRKRLVSCFLPLQRLVAAGARHQPWSWVRHSEPHSSVPRLASTTLAREVREGRPAVPFPVRLGARYGGIATLHFLWKDQIGWLGYRQCSNPLHSHWYTVVGNSSNGYAAASSSERRLHRGPKWVANHCR